MLAAAVVHGFSLARSCCSGRHRRCRLEDVRVERPGAVRSGQRCVREQQEERSGSRHLQVDGLCFMARRGAAARWHPARCAGCGSGFSIEMANSLHVYLARYYGLMGYSVGFSLLAHSVVAIHRKSCWGSELWRALHLISLPVSSPNPQLTHQHPHCDV